MKKLLKIMAVVFVMVMMCGVAVSANTAINPTQITTGTEDINTIPERTYSYNASTSYSIKGGQYVGGSIVPITIPAPGTVYFNFTQNQSISASATIELWSDLNGTKGWSISNPYNTSSLQNKLIKVNVDAAGTYYIVIYTNKYNISKLTTNTISFKTYFVNAAYSAPDQVIQSGQILPVVYDYSTPKYYQINIPKAGHIAISSNANLKVEICDSGKGIYFASNTLNPQNNKGTVTYYLNQGLYYIKTTGAYNADIAAMAYNFYPLGSAPYSVTKKNQNVVIYPGDSNNYHYIKYEAPYTGYVTLTPGEGSAYVTLCNSKRKAISSEDRLYGGNASVTTSTYGVKNGTVYYLKVKSGYNPFGLNIKTTKVSEKSGTSKKKAKTIRSNKTVKGTIRANSNTVDWYKFKVTKKKSVNVWFKGKTNNALKVTVYRSNGKSIISTKINTTVNGRKITSIGKWPKGTYYLKVERANKKSSGYYTLKWK